MKIFSKEADLEHARRLSLIMGSHVYLAVHKMYTKVIRDEAEIDKKLIEIKKKIVFEKNVRLKVLMIYTT